MRHERGLLAAPRAGRPGAVVPLILMAGLLAGCAGSPHRAVGREEATGYRGVVLQAQEIEKPAAAEAGANGRGGALATGVRNAFWVPWRAFFGVIGFALAGDLGPIPFTGLRWFSSETSPWLLGPGETFLAEDVYGPGEWPGRSRPLIGRRGPDPILLPSRADP